MAESLVGCFDISSGNGSLGGFFGKGQKAATFFTKISQDRPLDYLLMFFSEPVTHIALSTAVFPAPLVTAH